MRALIEIENTLPYGFSPLKIRPLNSNSSTIAGRMTTDSKDTRYPEVFNS